MGRILTIYLILALVSRVIRGFQESKRSAPKRREPQPYRGEGEVVPVPERGNYFAEEEEVMAAGSASGLPGEGEGVTREWSEGELEPRRREEGERIPGQPQPPRTRRVTRGPVFQTEAWAQGVIMAELLSPPRSQRPWRPPLG